MHPSDGSDDVLQVFDDLLQPVNFPLSSKDAQDFYKVSNYTYIQQIQQIIRTPFQINTIPMGSQQG